MSNQGNKIERPRTRAYIKQESEDSKESLNCALYSSLKNEPLPLEMSEYKSSKNYKRNAKYK